MHAIGFGPRFTLNRQTRGRTGFDFSGGVLPPGATLARGSPAACHDATGALVALAAGAPRFDHDPVTHALRGLLLEGASTNLVAHSADWTAPYWSKFALTASSGTLIDTGGTSGKRSVVQASGDIAFVAGQAVTLSVIARERTGSAKRYLALTPTNAAIFASAPAAIFDLAGGSVVASGATAGAVPAGGGAWLCWTTVVPVAAASGQPVYVRLTNAPDTIQGYVGDGASGIDVGQVQVEQGGAPTSRIATSAGPATRAADVLTLDWRSHGVADGSVTVRYGFDDGSTQDVATVVSGGAAAVPTTLARRWLRGARAL